VHGITLLHVTHGTSVDLSVLGLQRGEPTEMMHIDSISLQYADDTETELPRESNILTYYSHQTLLKRTGTITTVDAVITAKLDELPQDREYRST
jgi:hypothetical protein